MSDKEEIAETKSKLKAQARIEAERKRQADAAEAHKAAVAAENVKAKSELDKVLDGLPEAERREVRKAAFLQVINSNFDMPCHFQAAVDQMALRIARYVLEGKV